ncbi:complement C5 isoform X2 [Gasterosteus aculeatus]
MDRSALFSLVAVFFSTRMKLCVLLMCVCGFCGKTKADSRSYLITAPLALRLDAVETVLLQLFGFPEEVKVYVMLKTSMAVDHVVLFEAVATLNRANGHQGTVKFKLAPGQLGKSVSHVTLHVQSAEINQHLSISVTRDNGFLFLQTDKPLYTPHQSVKVRAFSLNQELMPANRSVFLIFKDPDQKTVDIVEINDVNNGIPSMQNPFKIPIKPKLGIWTIEASYTDDFTTTARVDFEVKEYVLPSFDIHLEPGANYISYESFNRFTFKVSARYVHGAPVADGVVYLRYGYVTGKTPAVIISTSVTRQILSSTGEVDVTVNMEKVLSKHHGPKNLPSLAGKYLYIAVLLQESTGGLTQEAEFAAVKFVKSPYSLSLVSTPPFIKPGLPYNIQVLVKDHLDKPVNQVQVRLVEQRLFGQGRERDLTCPPSSNSLSHGLAAFICNIPSDATRVVLKFETAGSALPLASQASLTLEASAYHSPNSRYLYIDPPLPGQGLQVGHIANMQVYYTAPSYVPVNTINYLVLSKGKLVNFGSQKFISASDHKQTLSFEVTGAMVPSVRVLVYFILTGEGTNELVADSVWLDVRDKCVNRLRTSVSHRGGVYKPKESLQLDIQTNAAGLVALSAVDSALYTLRPDYRDPVTTVLRHLEGSDMGCGGGGGRDAADVFRSAGLTFITNGNARPSASVKACTAAVRPKREVTEEEKKKKAESFGSVKNCCEAGMRYIPKSVTCQQFAQQKFRRHRLCREAFRSCCEYLQQNLDQDLILGRNAGVEFDIAPSLIRSYFPESWIWEVQHVSSGERSLTWTLPDSLTTWDVKAVGVFQTGVCVAEPLQVSVRLPLSVDVRLPYQVIRGEQVELKGSVYNQQNNVVQYCVTLTAGPAVCLQESHQVSLGAGLHSTSCSFSPLSAGGVAKVSFTLLGLEVGDHTLTFDLRTSGGGRDILEKKLRVVPEGVRREEFSGGHLDPRGFLGSEKRTVTLKNRPPANLVPNTLVERLLTINGDVLGNVVSVVYSPEGLRNLLNLPDGSAEAALAGVLPLAHLYLFLEGTESWDTLGGDVKRTSADLRQKIREGLISISSFRRGDSSFSMWLKREPSTWLTALVVRTLALVDSVFSGDHQALSESVSWLIHRAQQPDGSFTDESSWKPNSFMAAGTPALDQSVYLTSFVLIALHRATSIRDRILQLAFHDRSMKSAANYISQHAQGVKSVYVRAVATFALTLRDASSQEASALLDGLEKVALNKGSPVVLRYWQESSVTSDWLKPDQSSGVTVETTAYVLLTLLLKGRISDANPVLSWLTQDQHYGGGFYTVQDTALTLEAVTEYSKALTRAVLRQDISVRYSRKGDLGKVHLSRSKPVATPIQVTKDDDITVSTGYGTGVSHVKMKTVYYETTSPSVNCNFDLTIEVSGPDTSSGLGVGAPHLVACVKYKPPNEEIMESSLTVMKIQMPTGVEGYLEDLRQFRDPEEPMISHYELQGNTVVIQMDSVPSDVFLCVGFRIRTGFRVGGASDSVFSVYEPQVKGSECTKTFSYQQQRLQRLCVDEQCQCMAAACASFRSNVNESLTADQRTYETCRPHITYAFKVTVKSSAAEGDFMTYTASVVQVLKKTQEALQAVSAGTEVELVKKATCSSVDIHNNKQYLVFGTRGSEVTLREGFKYRLPLDSEALVELWPSGCSSSECQDISQLEEFALNLLIDSCPDSS